MPYAHGGDGETPHGGGSHGRVCDLGGSPPTSLEKLAAGLSCPRHHTGNMPGAKS